jgi:ABC-2 type transport system permease protein
MALRNVKENFVFVGNLMNGYLIGHFILQALYIHIPFLIVLVGGDLLAGEATSGTYRMLITRPVSRFNILTAKYLSGIIYTIMLLFFLALLSLGVSLILFGSGELLVFRSKIYIFASSDVLWRFGLTYAFAVLSLSTVLGLSFLFSSLVENAIGPIIATMAVIIIFLILSALPIEALSAVKPYLFTNYMFEWRTFFTEPVEYEKIYFAAGILLAHI